MSATLRYRGDKNNLIELAKNLDAFKKVPEKYTETTEIGGTLSLLSRLLIIFLIYKEVMYYKDAKLKYQFEPDVDTEKVQMHVDITVAMPCNSLSGVDLLDETQQDVFAYGTLQRQGVWWQLAPNERIEFERQQYMNHYHREQYHSIADILFKDIIKSNEVHEQPLENGKPITEDEYDACRLHGSLGINKVSGVLHLVGGAMPVVDLFGDHLMIGLRRMPANFTHRINRLSFGQYSKHIVQPLEGDEVYITDEETTIQYFLNIVPTEIHKTFSTINTYQYSVTENKRVLDPVQNSYGNPGIYFKYDWSALKIIVRADRDNIVQFTIRLCSIISGIIAISGILNYILVSIQKSMLQLFAPQLLYKRLKESPEDSATKATAQGIANVLPPVTPIVLTNELISNANKMSAQANALLPAATTTTSPKE